MPDVDTLSIQVEASARKAHTQMNNLIKKLEKLNNTLSGLDVSSVTTQLGELSNIDFSNLDKVSNLRLPRGGSGSFGGGRSSIGNMSGAIRTLGRSFSHVRSGLTSATRGLAGFTKNISTSHIRIRGLASSLMNVYFKLFMIKRLFSGFGTAITKSMDMVETYHYFDVAMGKVGNEAREDFAKYGYDSAEAYAKSFRDRSLELTERMSGYTFDENGNYKSNGLKNLGLDADTIMQYQAQYGQMANSIGMSGEAALATSKALTMLATDWSSLRNIDFDTAFQKMASGLAGQSRAVRALGIDITQASLQQTAYNLGITTSISKMDQAAKAELRMITILDQSRVAWGDLAETLNTPANQFRMLQQNAVSLARALGNIFMPIVQKVLPYINALVIALRWLFEQIAGLLGIQTSGASGGIGGLSEEFADLGEDASDSLGNIADGANGANSSMEKLKRTVLSFDELNILNDPNSGSSNSGSGSGGTTGLSPAEMGALDSSLIGLLDEYQRVWDEAFGKMGNKAQELSDKITGVFKKIWDYVQSKDWRGLGQYFASGINIGLDAVYSKLTSIGPKILEWTGNVANILNGMVDGVNWSRIGEIIGAGLNIISLTVLRWYTTFNGLQLGLRLADAFNSLQTKVNWETLGKAIGAKIQWMLDFALGFVNRVKWTSIGRNISTSLNSMIQLINWGNAGSLFANSFNGVFAALNSFNQNFDWKKLKFDIQSFFSVAIHNLDLAYAADTLASTVGKALGVILETIESLDAIELGGKLADAINKIVWNPDLALARAKLRNAIKNVLKAIREAIDKVDWVGIGNAIGAWFETIPWEDVFITVRDFIMKAVLGIWSGLGDSFAGTLIQALIVFKGISKLSMIATKIWKYFKDSNTVANSLSSAGETIFTKVIKDGIPKVTAKMSELLSPLLESIKTGLSSAGTTITEAVGGGSAYGVIGAALGLSATIAGLVVIGEKIGQINDEAKGGNGIVTDYGYLWDQVIDRLKPKLGDTWQTLFNIKEELENSGAPAEEFATKLRSGLEEAGIPAEDVEYVMSMIIGDINATATQMGWLSSVTEGYTAKAKELKDVLDYEYVAEHFSEQIDNMDWGIRQLSGDMGLSKENADTLQSAILNFDTSKPQESFAELKKTMEGMGLSEQQIIDFFKIYFPQAVTEGTTDTKKTFGEAVSTLSTKADTMKQNFKNAWNSIKGDVTKSNADVEKDTKEKYGEVEKKVTGTNKSINIDSEEQWNKVYSSIVGVFKSINIDVGGKVSDLASDLHLRFTTIATTLPNHFKTIGDDISAHFSDLGEKIEAAMQISGLYNLGASIVDNLQSGLSSRTLRIPHVSWNWETLEYGPADNRQWFQVPNLSVSWYARGGSPNAGELFWMNENNNPELMYKKGGRTHIDSNTEIVNSLKEAVIDGMMEVAMATSGQQNNNSSNTTFEVVLQCDSETLARTVQKGRQKLINRGFRVESAY